MMMMMMYDQVVESCDCVDEETECSDARVQGEERIQQVLSVAGNTSEQFAIGVITDTGESCLTLNPVTQFRIEFRTISDITGPDNEYRLPAPTFLFSDNNVSSLLDCDVCLYHDSIVHTCISVRRKR